ncbi:MAG: hypothetical protein ACRD28_03610, partial [Acidobacteriaceae bacterium]
MGEFLSNFGGFVAAVAVHWLTLLAGCGATVILALIQKFVLKMEKLPLKIEATILLCFMFFACFQAWQDEHRHAASAQSQFESLTKPNLQAQITNLYFAPASEGVVGIV